MIISGLEDAAALSNQVEDRTIANYAATAPKVNSAPRSEALERGLIGEILPIFVTKTQKVFWCH